MKTCTINGIQATREDVAQLITAMDSITEYDGLNGYMYNLDNWPSFQLKDNQALYINKATNVIMGKTTGKRYYNWFLREHVESQRNVAPIFVQTIMDILDANFMNVAEIKMLYPDECAILEKFKLITKWRNRIA
jgi:hypothetical protein